MGGQDAGFRIPDGWTVSRADEAAEGQPGFRITHAASGLELVWVPGGTFRMGSDDGEEDEQPVHEVALGGYWIGRTEVTVAQYRAVMGSIPDEVHGTVVNDQGDDRPVVALPQRWAVEFCGKLGLRLPTEAEWEYAARGPEDRLYPWGNEWDPARLCWNEFGEQDRRPMPVGSFPEGASWCGALDMAGNVWEWCADWYDEDYYAVSPRENPTGPAAGRRVNMGFPDGSKHYWDPRIVTRGGCCANADPHYFRGSMRCSDPSAWHYTLGFRVARAR